MNDYVTIKAYVYECDYFGDKPTYSIYNTANSEDQWHTLIAPVEIQFQLPDGYNSTAQKLRKLEEAKRAMHAEYLKRVAELNEQIGKLQALTNEVQA